MHMKNLERTGGQTIVHVSHLLLQQGLTNLVEDVGNVLLVETSSADQHPISHSWRINMAVCEMLIYVIR